MKTVEPYDALLVVSFGGPEKPEDVMPFLRHVVRGRNIPDSRLAAVAEHYYAMGGKSPINDQCRGLIAALRTELQEHGIALPIYWGNRNWDPWLVDALKQMHVDGVRNALAYVTSAFSSYSGCRQYLENIEEARAAIGPEAPKVDKLRGFFNHPMFIETMAERVQNARDELPQGAAVRLVFTAHSIPVAMASGCAYEAQLREASRLVAEQVGPYAHDVVYQSRSGPPQVPWLGPDVLEHLRSLAARGEKDVVLVPIGFVSDHMEVQWDLDREARELADDLGMRMARAGTVGSHPRFVAMLRELIEERLGKVAGARACGSRGPLPDRCAPDCCAYSPRRPGGALDSGSD